MTLFSIFVVGLFAGSFLNCIIYRMEVGGNFLKGRSYCPKCKKNIFWFDLIPVFSFFILGGKCRYCSSKISFHYPIVELSMAIIFSLVFYYAKLGGNSFLELLEVTYILVVFFLFSLIFIYDLKHFIVPDEAIISIVGLSFVWFLLSFVNNIYSLEEIFNYLLSGIFASFFFLFFFLISKGAWMGFGDVKLGFVMGLFLGFPQIIVALFVAFLTGSIVGLSLIIFKKRKMKSEIPFAPFLISGVLVSFFWGEFLLTQYLIFSRIN